MGLMLIPTHYNMYYLDIVIMNYEFLKFQL
jgi:hypothetical protein